MKIIALIIIGIISVSGLWLSAHRFEFHTDKVGGSGIYSSVIWRCDHWSGRVEHALLNDECWKRVAEPSTNKPAGNWVPPEAQSEIMPSWARKP